MLNNMAIDKKSDYYTHPEGYRDLDGNHRQFTTIDHDVKTSVPTGEKKDLDTLKKELAAYKESLIEEILNIPPSLCPSLFHDFTLRGDIINIEWNEVMLRDPGVSIDKLRDIKTFVSKAFGLLGR
jgi:hypothetical protein